MKKKGRKLSTKSHKRYQRISHSQDRVRVRNWIKKGDFDVPVPTHGTSKSLKWLID